MMNSFYENINIKFLKQIIMVMVQVVVEWSKKCCNLKCKKMGVNPLAPHFDFKVYFLNY